MRVHTLRTGFGILKKCAAMYNVSKGKLDKSVGEAIIQAADEVWWYGTTRSDRHRV